MPTIVRGSSLVWLPWKNGGGVMADIAAAPRLGGSDPDWRVSIAKVERDGPFSHFADTERGMMLIDGERLDLHVGSAPPLSVQRGGPAVVFPGDQPTRGEPFAGAIVNLNAMVRRSAMRQRMIRWQCHGSVWLPVMHGGKTFAYVQRGAIRLAFGDRATLAEGDTLIADAPVQIDGAAELIEINLWPA